MQNFFLFFFKGVDSVDKHGGKGEGFHDYDTALDLDEAEQAGIPTKALLDS